MAETLKTTTTTVVPVCEANNTPVAAAAAPAALSAVPSAAISTPLRVKSQPIMSAPATPQTPIAVDKVELVQSTPAAGIVGSNANSAPTGKGKAPPKPPEEFFKDLQQFHERRGTPVMQMPKISGREIDLHRLYAEVTERGGFAKVNQRDEWDEVLPELGLRDKCVNASAAVKYIYRRCLEKYERLNFFGEDPDKIDALEAGDCMESSGRSRSRYPMSVYSSNGGVGINAVAMTYNYRQHIVNMDRRRYYHLSTDLHKSTPYEKLMLSLISPLPNEQDFAINACTLMANESKHTLKLNEYPKLLDVLLAHTGVFADYTLRKLFQHVYTEVRQQSLFAFWRDLLHDKPQILELHKDEQALRQAGLIEEDENISAEDTYKQEYWDDCNALDFLNLGRGEGTQEYVGQRLQQVVTILRNLSFFEENLPVFAKNRTFLRFIVMSSNIRWGNIHNQVLDIAGNVAAEVDLLDPATDEVSRSLLTTLSDGIESMDRGVIINCLEILYKLCQRDSNEDYINKCLNLKFYETLCQFLSLNDIMLLIFSLEAVYALTSMGARSCHLIMQVRGIVDQLVSLITVEAQSYGPDGCILMRVVETVPGNMLPMVAQNIANLQNVSVLQKQQHTQQHHVLPTQPPLQPVSVNAVLPPPLPQPQLPQVPLPQPQLPQVQLPQPQLAQSQPQLPQPQLPQPLLPQPQLPQPQLPQPQLPQPQLPSLAQPQPQLNAQTEQVQQSQHSGSVTNVSTSQSSPQSQVSQVQQQSQSQSSLSQITQICTHDDEQYALAWLGATFERAASVESHVEQQELYRMYLSHCQKSGKHSVVNHLQFPRLVRLIFNINVGPVVVRRSDGTELSGHHYVAIRLRAQPLPVQSKIIQNQQKSNDVKLQTKALGETVAASQATTPVRKLKKKPKLQQDVVVSSNEATSIAGATITTTSAAVASSVDFLKQQNTIAVPTTAIENNMEVGMSTTQVATTSVGQTMMVQSVCTVNPTVDTTSTASQSQSQQQQQQQPSSSLIKSLLANKVTQRQQKQKELTMAGTAQTTTQTNVVASTACHSNTASTVSQMQHPIKVTSTAISALVNNSLMQNTPVKVGQTTIKPLNPQTTLDKKQILDSAPPPLAPLSGNNVAKDSSGRPVAIANKMLVDILDKKTGEPPIPTSIIKRKAEDMNEPSKRLALESAGIKEDQQVTPSKNAANLYAEMAASILEDEELEDIPPLPIPTTIHQPINEPLQQPILIPAKLQQAPLQNVQRQLLFQSNNPPQLKLTHTGGISAGQLPTAMATIKTDQGLQTVPVILQQKPMDQSAPPQIIQQVIQQPPPPQQPTQYVLATNQQGQTYLVAQPQQPVPPPPPTQTVLVTQTPQQQSAGTKTIIILQQQAMPVSQHQQIITGGAMGTQKMIMTTPQGQQVLVTQSAQPTLTAPTTQRIFINPQTGAATHIQHVPVSAGNTVATSMANTNQLLQRHQLLPTSQTCTLPTQQATGQISPSLLSQLNHIPATIKLHQPQLTSATMQQPHQHQPATISRIGKSVSILQTPNLPPPPPPIQIPQLQQHQSIIQQHIISGPTDKRQVILGGRAIEIKETVITQATPPPQQSQLNSQTIITKQVLPQQQQQHHPPPSIIQQKITLPLQQQPLVQKMNEHPSLIQATLPTKTQAVVQTPVQQPTTTQAATVKRTYLQHIKPQPQNPTQQLLSTHTNSPAQTSSSIGKSTANTNAVEPPPLIQANRTPTPAPLSVPNTPTPTPTAGATTQLSQQRETAKASESSSTTAASSVSTTSHIVTTNTFTTSTTVATTAPTVATTAPTSASPAPIKITPSLPTVQLPPAVTAIDPNWLYICDWRNCPRRKFKSVNDLQHHSWTEHCPDHLDPGAEIFCQWGIGPGLCDGIPRKRYSLMTHIIDRHLSPESLRAAMQRRIATGTVNLQPSQPPVTIVRNVEQQQRSSTASPALSTSSSSSSQPTSTGSSAMQAIKRHTADLVNSKELMDENEGPVTKSMRLTAALILRNLVTYTSTAKRSLRRYEPHLANVALSNVESSGAISHILFELNN